MIHIHTFVRFLFFGLVFVGVLFLPKPTNVDLANNNLPIFSPGFFAGTDRLGRDNLALFCYGSFSTIVLVIPARIFTIFVSFFSRPSLSFFLKNLIFYFLESFLYLWQSHLCYLLSSS